MIVVVLVVVVSVAAVPAGTGTVEAAMRHSIGEGVTFLKFNFRWCS